MWLMRASERGRPIHLVLFDLYGTLLYEDGGVEATYPEMARQLGLHPEEFAEARRNTGPDAISGRLPDALTRAHATLEILGIYDDKKARLLARLDSELRLATVHPYPATKLTLAELKRRGFRLALVSDCTSPLGRPALEQAGVIDLFDALSLSHERRRVKPDPELFLFASRSLNIEPAHCIYVGDGGGNEMAGAGRLGMLTVLIDQEWAFCRTSDVGPVGRRISSLDELLTLPELAPLETV